ncbi:MAG: thymidine phosphorylase [Candidatus Pacearchaeota archaeon]|jgi:AMP phosphorylase
MKLKIKFLKWSAGLPVAMLNKDTAEKIGINLQDRISIKTHSKEISTIVDTIGTLIKKDEIAVSIEIQKILNLKPKQKVDVNLAPNPESLKFIKEKLKGKYLSRKKIMRIISDIISNSLSESEIALFVSGMYQNGMTFHETVDLIDAILKSGNILKIKNGCVVDKHSIGGITGRVTPIVVSICASAGLAFPKTSSRAITTPAGTADAMETLCEVEFSSEEIKRIIKKTNACIVWGGGLGMVPADNKIIRIEKHLNLDPEAQLLASIMAKKLSVGSKYIVIHIPYGKTAKVKLFKALRLKRKFEKLGKHFHVKVKCLLTKNFGPVGYGIGPSLEMMDVLKVLKREDSCYLLEKRALQLAGTLLEMTGKAKSGAGIKKAKEILDSKKAFEKFKQIVKAQKGSLNNLKLAPYKKIIHSHKSGIIKEIDNKKINSLAGVAGCPADKLSGIFLHAQVGSKIKKQEKLLTIYSESKPRLKEAVQFYQTNNPFHIR